MAESKVGRLRKRAPDGAGEEGNKRQFVEGGGWARVSYERRDGGIQVQYILFDSGGCVHSVIDGTISGEAERWHNNVDPTCGANGCINRVGMVPIRGWNLTRMVGEMDSRRARQLVDLLP